MDNAAGERRAQPVDVNSVAQGSCGFVDAASREQHDLGSTRNCRGKKSGLWSTRLDPLRRSARRLPGREARQDLRLIVGQMAHDDVGVPKFPQDAELRRRLVD